MARKLWGLVLVVGIAACVMHASRALAQNLQDPTGPAQQGLQLDLFASGELRSGNVNLTLLNVQTWGRYTQGAHYASLRLVDSFGALGSARFMNAFRGLAQYRYALLQDLLGGLGGEAIAHYDRDEFRRREHLLNVGGGPYVSLFNSEKLRWTITTAYVFEFEKFAKLTSEEDPTKGVRDSQFELNAHRAWIASEFGWEIAKRVHIGEDILFQVPLDHCPCDTRAWTTTFVRVYGNDYAALQTGLTVLYDSRPAINVKSFDAIIRTSLVLSL
jgi:hypothetical protein